MKVAAHQLTQNHLAQLNNCIISGKDPYQREKAYVFIKQHLLNSAPLISQRAQIDEAGFQWDDILYASQNGSLFQEQYLFIIRSDTALKKAQMDKIQQVFDANSEHVFLFVLPTLNKTQFKYTWVNQVIQQGLMVEANAISPNQFISYIQFQFKQKGIQTTQEGYQLLAHLYQGNLYELDQIINILPQIYDGQTLAIDDLKSVVSNQSNYSVFQCIDFAMAGQTKQSLNCLQRLQQNKTPDAIVLWNLSAELRQLINMKFEVEQGSSIPAVLDKFNIWHSKKQGFTLQLSQRSLNNCYQLLQQAKKIDAIIKGIENHDSWLKLAILLRQISQLELSIYP
mgnify:CR=1 FL=1